VTLRTVGVCKRGKILIDLCLFAPHMMGIEILSKGYVYAGKGTRNPVLEKVRFYFQMS